MKILDKRHYILIAIYDKNKNALPKESKALLSNYSHTFEGMTATDLKRILNLNYQHIINSTKNYIKDSILVKYNPKGLNIKLYTLTSKGIKLAELLNQIDEVYYETN